MEPFASVPEQPEAKRLLAAALADGGGARVSPARARRRREADGGVRVRCRRCSGRAARRGALAPRPLRPAAARRDDPDRRHPRASPRPAHAAVRGRPAGLPDPRRRSHERGRGRRAAQGPRGAAAVRRHRPRRRASSARSRRRSSPAVSSSPSGGSPRAPCASGSRRRRPSGATTRCACSLVRRPGGSIARGDCSIPRPPPDVTSLIATARAVYRGRTSSRRTPRALARSAAASESGGGCARQRAGDRRHARPPDPRRGAAREARAAGRRARRAPRRARGPRGLVPRPRGRGRRRRCRGRARRPAGRASRGRRRRRCGGSGRGRRGRRARRGARSRSSTSTRRSRSRRSSCSYAVSSVPWFTPSAVCATILIPTHRRASLPRTRIASRSTRGVEVLVIGDLSSPLRLGFERKDAVRAALH